ncbi:hypothetical protein HMPREF0322_03551 [Desulfitobacterium hafniense DP7]|uniref:Uncharacterized protein n=1 Tax=Desulfitobacterium hafniense DP7 TaxID=537010 RepID=G9XRF2_DESHA|nr:hypothetical protein HMPREF0322_03551 [Desulfitobacterium hafniense DP7]
MGGFDFRFFLLGLWAIKTTPYFVLILFKHRTRSHIGIPAYGFLKISL